MKLDLSYRMQNIKPSPTVRLNSLAQELAAQGKDVINLTAGETDFDTPDEVVLAAQKAISSGKTRYTSPSGTQELRDSCALWLNSEFGLRYDSKNITFSCGVKQGLFHLMLSYLNEGDEVIILSPYWVSYPEMVQIAGAVPKIIDYDGEEFCLPLEKIKKQINPKTKMIILNSPNNPCGGMYSKKELLELANLLEKTDVLVASDEIYAKLVYGEVEFVSFATLSDDAFSRTVTFNGLSKSHAMTGWRVGFAAGPEKIIKAMTVLQGQSSTHIPTFVQYAAQAAFSVSGQILCQRFDDLRSRRDYFVRELQQIKGFSVKTPPGAFYVFPDCASLVSRFGGSDKLSEFLLEKAGVVVVPGNVFGNDKRIRLSYSKSLNLLEQAVDRIKRSLQNI
ncbi:MAG: pyridoxal phosphate-dependent aminotransferase [Oligoflexia bacterium]|nr:pyridoxal phosphate-dependent aminotransferase [Oligoflexia bacterium]